MDPWAIIVTGGVGLAAGQVGAWLQGRRDAAADQRKQSAEIERLNLQLGDSREARAREREQRDLFEWRERRLDAYQRASAAYQAISKNSFRLSLTTNPEEIATAIFQIEAADEELEDQLEKNAPCFQPMLPGRARMT
ncbi:hypothetical protein JOF29_005167 [Kribbella aluminosa]|uniref:Uncharacterized protein n=1 Tax=Kribbella aluminosa TaxID=416017 RepID=A0ABS4UQZ5_9ACTN|nr:hypothetical protein [Kribbella aluminosa]MBP2354057.1 hypothetical protein [Kribbella aluminosa]